MTGSELILTLNNMIHLMMRGQTSDLARMFVCPLPLYMLDMFILIRDRSWVAAAYDDYRDALLAAGVEQVVPGTCRIEDGTDNRCLVLVRWDHLLPDGSVHSSSTVRYVMRRGSCHAQAEIELVEYVEVAFPELSDRFRNTRPG